MDKKEKLIKLVQTRINWDTYSYVSKKEIKKGSKSNKKNEKDTIESEKTYKEALAYVKDAISPAFMKIFPNKIQINNTLAKTYFVYAYPNFLEWNWLSWIINYDVKFDMSLFVYPIESAFIQKYLKNQWFFIFWKSLASAKYSVAQYYNNNLLKESKYKTMFLKVQCFI